MTFDPTVLWPSFKAAGMLTPCTVEPLGGGAPFGIDVAYIRPDQRVLDGSARSTEHEVEYQHTDAPALQEGDKLTLVLPLPEGAQIFVVREAPFVSDIVSSTNGSSRDGFFRHALLTRVRS